MRLAAPSMARGAAQGVPTRPDVIFTTSLLNVAELRASLPRGWRDVAIVLYMHENQVAYPTRAGADAAARDVHFGITNLVSLASADQVIWNSRWNRDSFITGMEAVLRHAPNDDGRDLLRDLAATDPVIIWPPVEPVGSMGDVERCGVRVAWPHRWEHDKGPDELLELARRWTVKEGLRWTILGAEFAERPPALAVFLEEFSEHIDHVGHCADRGEYLDLLRACDWVLSTATHEFFGIAVVEAMLCGCLPWLPDRLSYPELLPTCGRGLRPGKSMVDPASVRGATAEHLAPAAASSAVASLDALIERTALHHA